MIENYGAHNTSKNKIIILKIVDNNNLPSNQRYLLNLIKKKFKKNILLPVGKCLINMFQLTTLVAERISKSLYQRLIYSFSILLPRHLIYLRFGIE